uniref:Uncharacterized protein n=1 Tax=Knipowitschia caucasica TaxID=637954 RepID=A0AAV2MKR9_KNICA
MRDSKGLSRPVFQLRTAGNEMAAEVSNACRSTLSKPLCMVAQQGHIRGCRLLREGKAIEDYDGMRGGGGGCLGSTGFSDKSKQTEIANPCW